jgi:AraC-like DNA-binding protein
MKATTERPSPLLKPYIAQYWRWELPAGTIIPDIYAGTGVECLFNLGDPLNCLSPYPSLIGTGESVILCPRRKKFQAEAKGKIHLLSIRFRSAGFYQLFKIPLIELADGLTDASNILPCSLFAQLIGNPSQKAMFTLLDNYLLHQLKMVDQDHLMNSLIDNVYYQNSIKFQSVISSFGVGERTLQRKFKIYTGVSGKYFQRTARFQSCVKALISNPKSEHSQLSLSHGYFDQAHFINEFKSFSGLTPQQFIKATPERLSHYNNSINTLLTE